MEKDVWSVAGWGVGLIALVSMLLRQVGPWRKQISDAEDAIRTELHEQINQLKDEMQRQRLEHATEMRAFNLERDEMGDQLARMEKKLSRQEIRHNAERALDRHRINNLQAVFDAMLLLIETTPEKATEIVDRIKQMRADQMVAEAQEKAIIRAAEIEASQQIQSDGDGG